jgi:hypothetical protein
VDTLRLSGVRSSSEVLSLNVLSITLLTRIIWTWLFAAANGLDKGSRKGTCRMAPSARPFRHFKFVTRADHGPRTT